MVLTWISGNLPSGARAMVERYFRMAWRSVVCRHSVALAGIALLALSSTVAHAQFEQRRTFTLGTAATTGLSHPVGVTLSALIKLKLLPVAGIDIDAKNSKGSFDNIGLLNRNEIQFAILSSLDAYQAWNGIGAFADLGPDPTLRTVVNLWSNVLYFVVRKELAPTGQFLDFLNLQGRNVALGRRGSARLADNRALFEAFGVDIDEAFQLQDLDLQASIEAFTRGELDALGLSVGQSEIEPASLLDELGGAAVLLGMTDDDISTANDAMSVSSSVVIPPGSYPGQKGEQKTVAINYLLAAGAAVEDEVVYLVTKTIFDNLPFLHDMHPATSSINLEQALANITMPVHPGARAYFEEVGIVVPEPKPIKTSNLTKAPFLTRFESVGQARERLNHDVVSILGGRAGQTIARFSDELAAGLKDSGVRVISMASPAPSDNIADVLYSKGVDSAFVPLDILTYAVEQNVYPGVQDKLVYATELFPEELHLVAAGDLTGIEDLAEKPVNLGARGSGSEFTSSFLFDALNIAVEPTYYEPRVALEMLRRGEIAAAVFVSGKPMPLLQEVRSEDGLHLLPVPVLDAVSYRPASLSAADYPNLVPADGTVATMAVRTALIAYDWQPSNPRYEVVSRFVDAFLNELSALQDTAIGRHPKWAEIDPFADIEGWRRVPAAQRWIDGQRGAPASEDGTSQPIDNS